MPVVVKAIGQADLVQAAKSLRLIVDRTKTEAPRDGTLKDRLELAASVLEAISTR
jgi:hypothetical protein